MWKDYQAKETDTYTDTDIVLNKTFHNMPFHLYME